MRPEIWPEEDSAYEPVAVEFQAIEAAEERYGDALGDEELLSHGLDLRRGDGVEAVEHLFNGEEVVEVHLLASEVGHA